MDDEQAQELEQKIEAAVAKMVRHVTWDGPYSRRVCHLSGRRFCLRRSDHEERR